MPGFSCNSNISSRNYNWIETVIFRCSKSLYYLSHFHHNVIETIELTVSPAKATRAPVLSFDRSIELDAGAEIPDKMILEHDATAEDIEAYAVTVQGAAVPPLPPVAVGGFAVDTEPV